MTDSDAKCQARGLLEDAREFLGAERWYADRGIPYRRGYLLHGMPGGGKSSLVMAVASELKLPIYLLTLSSDLMCDDALLQLMQTMDMNPSILLLEDLDAAHTATTVRDMDTPSTPPEKQTGEGEEQQEEIALARAQQLLAGGEAGGESAAGSEEAAGGGGGVSADKAMMMHLLEQSKRDGKERMRERERDREEKRGRLTLSGLLNALDGPTATMGRLLFMTTNHKDHIDAALLVRLSHSICLWVL